MYAPYSDVTSAWHRLKSPATDLFAQELIELTKMNISNFSINGILGLGIHGWSQDYPNKAHIRICR